MNQELFLARAGGRAGLGGRADGHDELTHVWLQFKARKPARSTGLQQLEFHVVGAKIGNKDMQSLVVKNQGAFVGRVGICIFVEMLLHDTFLVL